MSDVFEACWVTGKYLKGVKEAKGERAHGRRGGGVGAELRNTTFLHCSCIVYTLHLIGPNHTQCAGAHAHTHVCIHMHAPAPSNATFKSVITCIVSERWIRFSSSLLLTVPVSPFSSISCTLPVPHSWNWVCVKETGVWTGCGLICMLVEQGKWGLIL